MIRPDTDGTPCHGWRTEREDNDVTADVIREAIAAGPYVPKLRRIDLTDDPSDGPGCRTAAAEIERRYCRLVDDIGAAASLLLDAEHEAMVDEDDERALDLLRYRLGVVQSRLADLEDVAREFLTRAAPDAEFDRLRAVATNDVIDAVTSENRKAIAAAFGVYDSLRSECMK